MAAILVPVSGIDVVAEGGIGALKSDVSLDATGVYAAFTAGSGAAIPGSFIPKTGSDEEIVTEADDPDRHRLS
jgi:hypothetical protein